MKTLCLLLFPALAIAQESLLPPPISQAQSVGRKWTVSASFPSGQLLGPSSAIKKQMTETGWASTEPGGCFWGCVGPTDYPRLRRQSTFELEVGYRKAKRYGYQLGFGLPQSTQITGRLSSGNYLYLTSKVWYMSVRWAWYSRNGRFVNSVGPALLLFQDYESYYSTHGPSARHSQIRPGLHASSQFRFVDRRTWLLAFKVDFRTGLSVSTREYERMEYVYATTPATSKTVRFSGIDLPITHVNVGLQLGFKFL